MAQEGKYVYPLSPMQELWVKAFESGTGSAINGVQLNKNVTPEEVKAAANATGAKFPILTARIASQGKSKHEYEISTENPDLIPVEFLQWPLDSVLPTKNHLSDLHRLVEFEFGIPFSMNPNSVPVSQIHVYNKGGSVFIIFRLHGSTLDRRSAVTVTSQFLSYLSAAVENSLPEPTKSGELHSDFKAIYISFHMSVMFFSEGIPLPISDLIPKDIKSKGFLARGFDSVSYIASALKLALLPFQKGSADYRKHTFCTQFELIKLNEKESSKLLEQTEKNGSNLFGVESAAFLLAVAKMKQLGEKKEEYGITSMIDARDSLEPPLNGDSVGLYAVGLPLSYKVNESTSFWEIAKFLSSTSKENIEKRKMFSDMQVLDNLFSYVLKNPTFTPEASLRTSLCSVFTGAPQVVPWNAENLGIVQTVGPLMSIHGIGPCVAVLDQYKEKRLEISLVYTSPLFSREVVAELGTHFKKNLLAAAGLL